MGFAFGTAFGAALMLATLWFALMRPDANVELVDVWWTDNADRWESLRQQLVNERAPVSLDAQRQNKETT